MIQHSKKSDISAIQHVYGAAIAHQQARGLHVWESVDTDALEAEVCQNLHYSVWKGDELCAVFGICYSDPIIWGDLEQGDALYLHRIAILPIYMGKGLFSEILDWAFLHAQQHGRSRVRMDTWAVNTKIVDYYEKRGFQIVGDKITPTDPALPKQHQNLHVTLLEMPFPIKK